MTLAGLHLQLIQQGHIQPTQEPSEVNTSKYYFDKVNHAQSWRALGAELGIVSSGYSIAIEGFPQSTRAE